MEKKNKKNAKNLKNEVNQTHISFYDKTLNILTFILDEYSRELTRADIEFLEMPKNSIATLDFLISSIIKVQKGQRLALGLDDKEFEDLKAEYDTLYKMKNMEKSDEQIDRQKELKGLIDGFNLESNTETLKAQLSKEVEELAKGGVLAESYNEKARKGEAFTADLSQYKGKQRAAIERAIKSGVLNNTNKAHALVDTLSKIEADKGIIFDYTDNEKLKKSGFAIEGKTVNGFEKKDSEEESL